MGGADVIVGAPGAGLAWLILMSGRAGAVVEVAPQNLSQQLYWCPEVFGAAPLGIFGGLSRLSGLDHVCIRAGLMDILQVTRPMWDMKLWRNWNYAVDTHKLDYWVGAAVGRICQ